MKSWISFLSLCLFINVLAAQSSHPFLPEGVEKQWNVVFQETFRPSGASTIIYRTNGDTLISKREQIYRYTKIEQTRDSSLNNWNFRDFIREDTLQSKVYTYDKNQEQDFLLYDFSMEVGDTLVDEEFCISKVTVVDSIEIHNDQKRKRLLLEHDTYGFMYWIEGIGSSKGLFNRIQCYLDGPTTSLNCYFENKEKLYSNGSECFIVNTEEFLVLQQISLFPNPANGYLQLDLSEIAIPNLQIRIFSLLGQEMQNFSASTGQIQQIEVSDLASGVYFLGVEKEGQIIWGEKFIKRE